MKALVRGVVVVVAGGLLAGCGSGTPTLTVSPAKALSDHPLTVSVSGAADVTVRMETKAADGTVWRATLEPGKDLGRRLVDALKPADGKQAVFVPPRRWTMEVSVRRDGRTVVSKEVRRLQPVADGFVTETRIRPTHKGGLYADLFEPVKPTKGASAVVVIGGSEGGTFFDGVAAMLAAHGHPAIVPAYFRVPGRPKDITRIPLEYFHATLRRLARAPHVDPSRIVVMGTSRGSEAALLTATHWPGEVSAVVASVPSSVAGSSLASTAVPAWTYAGRPVPWTRLFGNPEAPDNPRAVIDVARIQGPVFMVCGGSDGIWPSCPFAQQIQQHLTSKGTLLTYPDAGHLAGLLLPGSPLYLTTYPSARRTPYGGTPATAAAARDDLWPKLLTFLDQVPG